MPRKPVAGGLRQKPKPSQRPKAKPRTGGPATRPPRKALARKRSRI